MASELAGDGPDTALARLLHKTQRLRLDVLRTQLEQARAGGAGLAESLIKQGVLSEAELAPYVRRLSAPVGRLSPGELVAGRYRVEALLGQGGMGAVYRAVEVATGRGIALKVLLPELAETVDVRRFEVEGEIGARVGGLKGFVPVHSAGLHRGLPYLAMDLIEGADLEERIDLLDPEDLAKVLAQVARALHAAHLVGVIHRDLKPANVLLDEAGAPLIADLGLARAGVSEALTQTGELLGTPAYMAPEQINDPRSVDARSDVYALGAILYRGLAGVAPFRGSLLQVLDHVLTRPPPAISGPRPAPRQLEAICLRALAKKSEERQPSALAFAEDLERFALGEDFVDPSRRPHRLAVGGVGILSILLVAILGWSFHDSESNPSSTPATESHQERTEAELSRELRKTLVLLAKGKRRDLTPLRDRASRAGLDPSALEAAALKSAELECGSELASSPSPAKSYLRLRQALSPALRDASIGLTDHAFRALVRAERPNWLEVARLSEVIRPHTVPAFAKEAATLALRKKLVGVQISAGLARACLQLDATLRGSGTLLWHPAHVPAEVHQQRFASGSATKAYLQVLKSCPEGAAELRGLASNEETRNKFESFESLLRRVLASPVQDLGKQYLCEVEFLLIRCSEIRGESSEGLRERTSRLRIRLEGHDNLGFLYDVVTYERVTSRPEHLEEVEPLARDLLNLILDEPLRPKLKPRDREALIVKSASNLLRDLIAFGDWEAAIATLERIDGLALSLSKSAESDGHLPAISPLSRAWAKLERAPREVLSELQPLAEDNQDLEYWTERSCARLLQARAHLNLEEKSAARAVLNSIQEPSALRKGWWIPIRARRDRILAKLDE